MVMGDQNALFQSDGMQVFFPITHCDLVKCIHLSGCARAWIPGGEVPNYFFPSSPYLGKINAVLLNLFEKLLKKKPRIIRSDGAINIFREK